MKSIAQIDQEQDIKSLIFLFLKLISLKELSHQVNFKKKPNLVKVSQLFLQLRLNRQQFPHIL